MRLLGDIATIFSSTKYLKLSSEELATRLAEIETSPWAEYKHGKPLTKYTLAPLLKPFDITPRTVRMDAQSTPRGYRVGMFLDAWGRYPEVTQELLNDARKDAKLMQEEEMEKQACCTECCARCCTLKCGFSQ